MGIFSVAPAKEPCALRSTQPLKVSTRYFSWGKGGRCVWLTTYHPCSAETSRKSRALIYSEPLGPPRPVAGDLYFFFTLATVQVTCSLRVRCILCFLILKVELVPPSLLRSSNVPSSFWSCTGYISLKWGVIVLVSLFIW